MKKKITIITTLIIVILIIIVLYALYHLNYIEHKKYTNKDFNIMTYKSKIDKDKDGIDDKTDISKRHTVIKHRENPTIHIGINQYGTAVVRWAVLGE